MEDGARESEVRGLNDLSTPELEYRVDSENDLEERESLSCWVVFKDMFTSYSKEGGELRSEQEKVRAIKGGVGKGSRNVWVFNSSEVPECQETRTPVTFFLISLTMDASPFLSLATFPPMYCLIDPILLPSLCVHHGQFFNVGPLPDHRLIRT